jgi:hypothetical protein
MKHALVKLGQAIDWHFLEERFGAVYTDRPGQPPLSANVAFFFSRSSGLSPQVPAFFQ